MATPTFAPPFVKLTSCVREIRDSAREIRNGMREIHDGVSRIRAPDSRLWTLGLELSALPIACAAQATTLVPTSAESGAVAAVTER